MNRVLSKAEIFNIVNDPGGKSLVVKWPNVRDKELILAAIRAKKTTVELSSGRFTIRYSSGIPWKTEPHVLHSTAFITPADDTVVPCGWFDEKSLSRELGEG